MYKCNKNNCEEIFDKEWELKCHIHYNIKKENENPKDLITVFYLNIVSSIKPYNLGNLSWESDINFHSGLLDFK